MHNLNSVTSLAYDKRNQIGKKIKVHYLDSRKRTYIETTIKEVGVCPWSNHGRVMYLRAFEHLSNLVPLKKRMQKALDYVTEYYTNTNQELDLRVTYFTDAKSFYSTSNHLHMMLDEREFEFIELD